MTDIKKDGDNEETSLAVKLFRDICCDSCACESTHNK